MTQAMTHRREDRAIQLWYAVNSTPWSEVPDWVRDNFRSAADGYEEWLRLDWPTVTTTPATQQVAVQGEREGTTHG